MAHPLALPGGPVVGVPPVPLHLVPAAAVVTGALPHSPLPLRPSAPTPCWPREGAALGLPQGLCPHRPSPESEPEDPHPRHTVSSLSAAKEGSCPEATFQGSRAEFLGWKEGLSMSPVPSHSPSSGPRTGNPALGGGPGVTAQVCTCGVLLGRKRLPPSPPRPPRSSPPQSPGHGDGPCRLPPALTESLGLLHYFNLVFGFFLF